MNSVLPWHNSLWQQVLRRHQQDRLPHALLLCGPQGMGKALFAQALTATLLCENPQAQGQACGHCKSCSLRHAGTHPDFLQVQPAEAGKQIAVDEIRHLIQFYALTTQYGRYKIVILNPAEAMNRNSANSLLKLLEEPPPKTLIMLVSHQPMRLLATIRSRCQRLDFSRPERKLTETWLRQQLKNSTSIPLLLNLSAQAPLAALALVETEALAKRQALFENLAALPSGRSDPISIANGWSKWDARQVLEWMFSWTMDIIRYAITGQVQFFVNYDHQDVLQGLAKQFNVQALFDLLNLQKEAYQLVSGKVNINPQGLLESIAITWVELGSQQRR
jgi:DNA polymerase-3 subunit delta'